MSTGNASRDSVSRLPSAGFLLIDKPLGVTSHDVVAACRGALHTRHVGHAGTLDPLASGLLVVGFGYATRLLKYVVGTAKTYEAVMRLGASTTTDDAEGEPQTEHQSEQVRTAVEELIAKPERITAAINENFIGMIDQVPSTYSAIKVNGERAYALARQGQEVSLAARSIEISEFSVLSLASVTTDRGTFADVRVRVTCSAGTYIRALARDLGATLGVGGYLTFLRRTNIGAFDVDAAVVAGTVERVFTDKSGVQQHRTKVTLEPQAVAAAVIDVVQGISGVLPMVEIDADKARDIHFGRRISLNISQLCATVLVREDGTQQLCAIVEPCAPGQVQPVAVFPAEN